MIRSAGRTPVGADKKIDMLVKDTDGTFKEAKTYERAVAAIDEMLNKGLPVIVGVDREKAKEVNANALTDHFVVIDRAVQRDGKRAYHFMDPGTSHENLGTSEENVLWYTGAGKLEGFTKYLGTKVLYTVTEVRPTL
jgi:hypothetical protein